MPRPTLISPFQFAVWSGRNVVMKTCQDPQQTQHQNICQKYAFIASGRQDGQLKWTILKEIMDPEKIFWEILNSIYVNKNKIT